MTARLWLSVRRARGGIAVIAVTYFISVTTGLVMAHAGSSLALSFRDRLVAKAHEADPAARANDRGAPGTAAALDFSRNLGLAAIPETIGGLTLVMPVGLAAYRGWVGGIVSVDHRHVSRLREPASALYFIVTLLLQLAAFTLAGGGGLHLGWSYFKRRGPFVGPSWFRLPAPALQDLAWLYVLVVPLFALGSVWEYFAPGN
jgi:uncharacterized membrane protein SpoIIM required for sporulation